MQSYYLQAIIICHPPPLPATAALYNVSAYTRFDKWGNRIISNVQDIKKLGNESNNSILIKTWLQIHYMLWDIVILLPSTK